MVSKVCRINTGRSRRRLWDKYWGIPTSRAYSTLLAITVYRTVIARSLKQAKRVERRRRNPPAFILQLAFSLVFSFNIASAEGLTIEKEVELESLLRRAQYLFAINRPIDARAKLQKALKLAPNDYRPHLFLSEYYLRTVRHFKLAFKYIRQSEELFNKRYGGNINDKSSPQQLAAHEAILSILSAVYLNLDEYEKSLEILDKYVKLHWNDAYPGTKGWILWKLGRVDEAIQIVQAGILSNADPRRTFNILGILLSSKDNREAALQAFSNAIRAEIMMGGNMAVATPLNNAGEVYREMFSDRLAEASWIKALEMPDGCSHILPSLNLATLYIDELRLFAAERVIDDYESCFREQSLKVDTEHSSLIALIRARIAYHMGDIDKAVHLFSEALENRQWFGSIGANENDVRFAATMSLSIALDAQAETFRDKNGKNFTDSAHRGLSIPFLELKSWWLGLRAKEILLDELNDLEDLFIRHTDAMLEYPSFGELLAGFPSAELEKRIAHMLKTDKRKQAEFYYQTYLAKNYLKNGQKELAEKVLDQSFKGFKSYDRLIKARSIASKINIKKAKKSFWAKDLELEKEIIRLKEKLYELSPALFRYGGFKLPISEVKISKEKNGMLAGVKEELLSHRFQLINPELKYPTRFKLMLSSTETDIIVRLDDRKDKNSSVQLGRKFSQKDDLINKLIAKVFSHRLDPPSEKIPALPITKGLL